MHAMTISAHKLYGPVGVGALIIDKRLPIRKLQFGGSQEKNLRAGTENVPAIVGFGKAAELATAEMQANAQGMCMFCVMPSRNGLKEFSGASSFLPS
jgi:cysteine desulfurase